ncbi:pyridoxal phosphate-dependent aminotransferase [Yinghuangia sp. YIM S09857]|uniref:pyridoxal phosphate-dependent aminotransferase n=1 Tax=Yinghuangia sp. YIM S09857 TaxID=3436929 RepID=UPI003F52A009
MESPATLAAHELLEERRRRGERAYGLAFGEAGLPVHPLLRAELAAAAGHNTYGPVTGDARLQAAVSGYWSRRGIVADPDLVVIGPGSKPLLYALRVALRGDVILPRPNWFGYAPQTAMLGGRNWTVPTPPGEGGVPDPELAREAVVRARAEGRHIRQIVVTIPDNPTGSLPKPETVRELCRVAEEWDLVIVSDEIYRDLVHEDGAELVGPAEIAPDRTVVTTGPSKSLGLGGWRLGAARFPDSHLGHRLWKRVRTFADEVWSAPSHPIQVAAATAFDEPDELVERVRRSARLHGRMAGAVAARWLSWGSLDYLPEAGFYIYPRLVEQARRLARNWDVRTGADLADLLLMRHGIGVLPGEVFGDSAEDLRLRIATSRLYGTDDEQRTAALEAADPLELPWISQALDFFDDALTDLFAVRADED